jgi:prophage regulatory protein
MFKTSTPLGPDGFQSQDADSDLPCESGADRFIPLSEVKWLTGIGKTTIYQLVSSGQFPRPIKIGGTASRWSLRDVQKWQNACRKSAQNSGRRP